MECSEPGAIRDEEFVAYLEGEKIRPAVIEHLARCQRCSLQLASYQRIERKLMNKLYRWNCPPSQVLGEYILDYQSGLSGDGRAAEVRNHLSMCTLCAAEVARLTAFLANDPMLIERVPVAEKRVAERPASLNNHHPVQDVRRILDDVRDQAQAGARRIVAALLPPQPRLAYQRDAAPQTEQWPRRYSAEDVNISIQVERGPGRNSPLQLIGFVTRQGVALEVLKGVPIQLSSSAHTVYTQTIDDLGNFVFSSLAPATYTLELQFPERIVVIEQISVSSQD